MIHFNDHLFLKKMQTNKQNNIATMLFEKITRFEK